MTARMFQIVSNTVRMHVSEILFSFVSAVPNRFKYRHNACFRDIFFIFFLQFQIVSNIGRRQNAPFTVIVFKIFSAVPNRFKYRQDACFRDIFLFFFLLCSSKSFKLPFSTPVFGSCKSHCQNACLKDIVFKFFSAAPNCFKYHQNIYFRGIVPGSYTPRTSDWIIW